MFFHITHNAWGNIFLFMLLDRMIRGILFLSCMSVCLFFCLSVCLSVCLLSTLTFAITFELKRGGDFIFSMHTPLMKPFQMTPRSMTLWPWLWPWSLNSLLDFVANRGIVFYKHTLIFYTKTFTLWPWL